VLQSSTSRGYRGHIGQPFLVVSSSSLIPSTSTWRNPHALRSHGPSNSTSNGGYPAYAPIIQTILDNLQRQDPDLLERELVDDPWTWTCNLDYTLVVIDREGRRAWFPGVDILLKVLLQAVKRECLDLVQGGATAFDGGGWSTGQGVEALDIVC